MVTTAQVALMSCFAQAPLPAAAPARPSQFELDLLVAAVRAEHADLTSVLADRWFGPLPAHPTVRECGLCTCHFPILLRRPDRRRACPGAGVRPSRARRLAHPERGRRTSFLSFLGRQCEPGQHVRHRRPDRRHPGRHARGLPAPLPGRPRHGRLKRSFTPPWCEVAFNRPLPCLGSPNPVLASRGGDVPRTGSDRHRAAGHRRGRADRPHPTPRRARFARRQPRPLRATHLGRRADRRRRGLTHRARA